MSVKKSEAALLLGITKSRISQLIARGLPVDANGLIDVDDARNWIEQNTDHARRAGWHEARGLTKPIASPSPHSGHRRQVPSLPDAYAPAVAFPRPGERGFALAAARTLHLLPLATVSAVAEAGGTAELASKVADLVLIGMWHLLDEDARALGFPGFQRGSEDVLVLNDSITRWSEEIPWDELFRPNE
jgi:hypothetical protein